MLSLATGSTGALEPDPPLFTCCFERTVLFRLVLGSKSLVPGQPS